MENSLLVLETTDEAGYFTNALSARDKRFEGCDLLALHPNIRVCLKGYRVDCVSTAEVMDEDAFKSVMDKCEALEDYIRCELERQNIERPAEYFVNAYWHFLRLIWRHLLWNIELLSRCLERKNYEQVLAFRYGRVITHSPWIEDDQLYMGDIAAGLCAIRGIEFVALEPPPAIARTLEPEPASGFYHTFCNSLAYFLCRFSASILARRKTLLVPSFKYNMNKVCDDLRARDGALKVGIFYLGRSGVAEVFHALAILVYVIAGKKMYKASVGYPVDFAFPVMTFARFHRASCNDRVEDEYVDATLRVLGRGTDGEVMYKGIGMSEFLLQKIRADLSAYMRKISFQTFGLEKCMEELKPKKILSQMNGEIYAALGGIAKSMGIPSVLISHGSHVYHRDKYAARDNVILARNILVGDYRYSAVESPLAREIALQMGVSPDRVVNIRPTLWGRAVVRKPRAGSGSLTIVHAGTFKLRHNRRYIYETSDEFLQGLYDLVTAVAPFPRLKLILKIRPDPYELTIETMNVLLPKAANVTVESEKPFLEVLEEADLVVSFSSTTIEEALTNNVPVLLYGAQGRYSHIPVEPFDDAEKDMTRAVTFVKDREGLIAYMSRLNEMSDSFSVSDDQFRPYRFGENEVVDFTDWFLGLGKEANT